MDATADSFENDAARDTFVVPAHEVDPEQSGEYGGKAVHLAELAVLDIPVPSWFAIPVSAWRRVAEATGLEAELVRIVDDLEAGEDDRIASAADALTSFVRGVELPEAFVRSVRTAVRALDADEVAVRSSGREEDAEDLSFAGVHESLLFVRDTADVLEAIRRVWASAFAERALHYRLQQGRDVARLGLGIVVQEMVEPAASGVAFTANPAKGDVEEVVVNALWGAGEGLVGRDLPSDRYVVDKLSREINCDVVRKETALVRAPEGGLDERSVPEEDRARPCLSEHRVRELVGICEEIERHFGRPQDVEFVVDESGTLAIVQSRPVTTVEERGPAGGRRRIWDNSNVVENYPGTTTPLTFTFIQKAYTVVYEQFGRMVGVSEEEIRRYRPELEHKLGLVRGRVYYNLLNWYDTMEALPGYRVTSELLESMLGVEESGPRGRARPDVGRDSYSLTERVVDVWDLIKVLGGTLWNFTRIRRQVEEFEETFEQRYRRWAETDFESMGLRELMEAYEAMERQFLWNWDVPILNNYYVMIFHGLFESICEQWLGDEGASLANDLLCGEGGIHTKEASMELLELAAMVDARPELREAVVEGELEAVHETVRTTPEFTDFYAAVREYLDRYGYRSMRELQLEEPTLHERPSRLYQMIRNYLGADDASMLDPDQRREREREIRRAAEQKAFDSLGLARRMLFKRVLRAARFGVKNRENMRFARTRIYGLVREVFRTVGRKLSARALLDRPNDIFYLGVDEIWGYVRGSAITTDLRGLVELRRCEFAEYETDDATTAPDDRFLTYGSVYDGNTFRRRPGAREADREGDLVGTGCCSGIVEGTVKIIDSPADDLSLSGEVLVAKQTDPGWVPLFPSASALLVEHGSLLSHSAIVAREMGLPAVVGIDGLTERLETGDRVRVDGEAGTVELLEEVA